MKKVAIVLSGCGVYDGSEIHEAVMAMLAVAKAGASYALFAPNIEQHHVINHLTGIEMPEKRNVLVESARIARGNIKDLKDLKIQDFDALLLPGGFGAAKNLSNYAFKGAEMTVLPEVERVVKETYQAGKPIGALCIAPVLLAKILGNNIKITIGSDAETIKVVESFGAKHQISRSQGFVPDTENKIFTAPCYMLDASITDIAAETEKLVAAMLK